MATPKIKLGHYPAGKEGKVAITAVMRKLVVIANTLIREDRPWSLVRPVAAVGAH